MIFGDDRGWRVLILALLLPVIAPLGCAGPNVSAGRPYAGMTCVDDSAECIRRRQATLRYLENDTSRTWVKQRPPPEAYASGVRLFALKKKKKELTCDELAHGRREADLSMTTMFGGFDPKFYDAYQETWPLAPGWEERLEIYQLHHHLNHLNLFGAGYLGGCLNILRKYA